MAALSVFVAFNLGWLVVWSYAAASLRRGRAWARFALWSHAHGGRHSLLSGVAGLWLLRMLTRGDRTVGAVRRPQD